MSKTDFDALKSEVLSRYTSQSSPSRKGVDLTLRERDNARLTETLLTKAFVDAGISYRHSKSQDQ